MFREASIEEMLSFVRSVSALEVITVVQRKIKLSKTEFVPFTLGKTKIKEAMSSYNVLYYEPLKPNLYLYLFPLPTEEAENISSCSINKDYFSNILKTSLMKNKRQAL